MDGHNGLEHVELPPIAERKIVGSFEEVFQTILYTWIDPNFDRAKALGGRRAREVGVPTGTRGRRPRFWALQRRSSAPGSASAAPSSATPSSTPACPSCPTGGPSVRSTDASRWASSSSCCPSSVPLSLPWYGVEPDPCSRGHDSLQRPGLGQPVGRGNDG